MQPPCGWRSTPLLAEFVEAGVFQIRRGHGRAELHVRLEGQEPRLGERGNLRRLRKVHHEDARALAAQLGEVGGLGLLGVQNLLHLGADGAVLHGGVERVVGHGDNHQCSHGSVLSWFWFVVRGRG